MSAHPQPLSALLREALERSPLREGIDRQEALECWPDVVGALLARHSRAISIHEGTLLVQVDGSVWAQELALLRNQILAGFALRLGTGAVRDLRFHSGRTSS